MTNELTEPSENPDLETVFIDNKDKFDGIRVYENKNVVITLDSISSVASCNLIND